VEQASVHSQYRPRKRVVQRLEEINVVEYRLLTTRLRGRY